MIWQDSTDLEKQTLIDQYNIIKQELLHLKGIRCKYESKEKYDADVKLLQSKYNNLDVQYICDNCGKLFNLDLRRIKKLINKINEPLFCNVKCSGQYYAIKQHREMSEVDWTIMRNKISNTLKEKEPYLAEEMVQRKLDGIKRYWESKSPEERSLINKRNAIVSKQTKAKKYGDENYNNAQKISNTWQTKSKELMRERSIKSGNTMASYKTLDCTSVESSYELDFYNYFYLRDIILTRNYPIKYTYKNKIKTTLIDFKIDNVLYECKGCHLLKGLFDSETISIKRKFLS